MTASNATNPQRGSGLHFDELVPRGDALTVHFTIWQNADLDTDCIARILEAILDHSWTCLSQKGSIDTMSSECPWLVEVIKEPDYGRTIVPLEFRLIHQRCRDLNSRLGRQVIEMLWAELGQLHEKLPRISQHDLVQEMKDFIESISSITLQHPNPTKQFQRNYSRCVIVRPWNGQSLEETRPEPRYPEEKPSDRQRKEQERLEQERVKQATYTAPGFYDGPLLGASRLGAIVSKYASVSKRAKFVSDAVDSLNLEKDPILKHADSGTAVSKTFPGVKHRIENCLETLGNIVNKTCDTNVVHDPRDICNAIYSLLLLRRECAPFTLNWTRWTDASKGKMLAHGVVTAAGVGALAVGITAFVMTAPVSAPAAAVAATGTAVTTSAVAAAAGTAATAGTTAAAVGTAATAVAAETMATGALTLAKGGILIAKASSATMAVSGFAAAGHEGYYTCKSVRDLAEMNDGVIINEQIDAELRGAAYYLAIGLMECCGIANPHNSAKLDQVLADIDGVHPASQMSEYRAKYLFLLIDSIWNGFQDLQKKMQSRGLKPVGGWLDYTEAVEEMRKKVKALEA